MHEVSPGARKSSVRRSSFFKSLPKSGAGAIGLAAAMLLVVAALGPGLALAASRPVISGLLPASGPATGGTTVTIEGHGFTSSGRGIVSRVTFGQRRATVVRICANGLLQVKAPAGSGKVEVAVTTKAGTTAATASGRYTYKLSPSAPVVTGLSASSGPMAGGATVTITGSGLANATAVDFGAADPATIESDTATQITVLTPSAGCSCVDVTVTTAAGTSATSVADQYIFVRPLPTVTGLSVSAGPLAGGTSVTITGTGLDSATAVDFGAGNPATIDSDSATAITVAAPAGTVGTVDVTVTTLGGTSATSAADEYAYVARPTISDIAFDSGDTVTITGANLTGATAVDFASTYYATFTVDSSTQITATFPPSWEGQYSDVFVITPGGQSAGYPYSTP